MRYASALCLAGALLSGIAATSFGQSYNDLVAKAKAEYLAGKLNDAVQSYTKAAALSPNAPGIYYNRGIVYYDLKDLGNAVDDFSKAISLDASYADAYFNRGNAYSMAGDYGNAVSDYTWVVDHSKQTTHAATAGQVVRSAQSSGVPTLAAALNNRGVAYFHMKQDSKAEADFRGALEQDKAYAEAHYNLGNVLYDQKKTTKAVAEYTSAILLNPAYREAYYNRGNAYYELGNPRKAISDFQKVIDLDKNFANAYYNLGLAYIQLSDSMKKK